MDSNSIFGLGLKVLQFEKIVPKLNPKDLKIERTKLKFVPKKPPQKKKMLKSRPKVVFIKKLLNIDTQKHLYIYTQW